MIRRTFLLFLAAVATRLAAANAPAASPVSAPARATTPAAAAPAAARDSSVAPTAQFDNFRLIADRNIFNPNRTGRRERTEEPPKTDYLALVGTLESDHGLRAFFDGSDSSLRKALRVGETVDKFKVTKITPNVVDLERDGKTLSMRVGQAFRRPEGADWNISAEQYARPEATAAKVDTSTPQAIPADASDTLRRLMERRQKGN